MNKVDLDCNPYDGSFRRYGDHDDVFPMSGLRGDVIPWDNVYYNEYPSYDFHKD